MDAALPLRLIGMRELRSHNSWMHNVEKLMRARDGQPLRMNPADAAARNHRATETSLASAPASGEVAGVPVLVTEDMTPGVVALPHGWGHRGGWRRANAAGGVNVNALASAVARLARAARGDVEAQRDPCRGDRGSRRRLGRARPLSAVAVS